MPREGRESELVLRFETWQESRFVWLLLGHYGTVQFMYARDPLMHIRGYTPPIPFMASTPGWMGYDVGYHSPEPMFQDHEPLEDFGVCPALPPHLRGSRCYYDGSALASERVLWRLLDAGGIPWTDDELRTEEGHRIFEDGVRDYLADYYHVVFYEDYDGPHRAGSYVTWNERRARMDNAVRTFRIEHGDRAMTEETFQAIVSTNFGPEEEKPRG